MTANVSGELPNTQTVVLSNAVFYSCGRVILTCRIGSVDFLDDFGIYCRRGENESLSPSGQQKLFLKRTLGILSHLRSTNSFTGINTPGAGCRSIKPSARIKETLLESYRFLFLVGGVFSIRQWILCGFVRLFQSVLRQCIVLCRDDRFAELFRAFWSFGRAFR